MVTTGSCQANCIEEAVSCMPSYSNNPADYYYVLHYPGQQLHVSAKTHPHLALFENVVQMFFPTDNADFSSKQLVGR